MLHVADGAAQERAKYQEIWSIPEYRVQSPGLEDVDHFMDVMDPPHGSSLIDIGCGEGLAGLEFAKRGFHVNWLDLTDAGLSPKVDRSRFIEAPLWSNWPRDLWDYGYCCDVLEHIPSEYTMICVGRILQACETAWLRIALTPDAFGQMIGEPLHLTVRPFDWWLVRLATLGKVKDARDLCGVGLYVVSR